MQRRVRDKSEVRATLFSRPIQRALEGPLVSVPILPTPSRVLLAELRAYPGGTSQAGDAYGGVAVPLMLRAGDARLSFLSTTTMFGTPIDITLGELAIEAFLPADAETAALLTRK